MKFLSTVFLFLFIAFLATPTLISVVDDQVDTSYFFTVAEEEENLTSFNDIKSVSTSNYTLIKFVFNNLLHFNFLVELDLSFANLAHQIFSPPPNFA
jgi:hypothetical protein